MKNNVLLTPEEELQVLVDKAKKKHGRVYKTTIADEVIVWRLLKRSEFKDIMNQVIYRMDEVVGEDGEVKNIEVIDEDATYDLRQELIAKAVILHPVGIEEQMAAVADIISTECMLKSGFGEAPKTEQC